jgi:flagellar M-ring protein FliF
LDLAKRYWTTILAQMERLPASTKMLIGSLCIIMLLVGFIALLYAGKPEMVPVSQFAASRVDQVVARLDASGIDAELREGQVYVPVNDRVDAIATLAREDMLSDDASSAFAAVTNSNPWETASQGRRNYLIATQDYLNAVARKFKGVESAEVVISMPERVGFGRSSVRPSASVTVSMRGNSKVDKNLVQSLAGLVSGAVAEMQPQDVVILDANAGRQHTVADENDIVPTEVVELVRQQEDYHRKKIEDMLRHIPGVIVAVKVSTDPIRREVREQREYEESEPLRSENDREMVSRDYDQAGEGGTRPNTQMTIDGGGGLAREQTETETRREFGEKLIKSTAQIEMAGHQIQQINVTVNVPRSYFVSIFKANNPDAEAPDADTLAPIRDGQLDAIKKQVQPLILAKTPGTIEANMVYDQAFLDPVTAGPNVSSGIVGTLTSNGVGTTVATAGMAAFSLLMLFMMVKRATKPQEMPSIEELAGVPPDLPSDEDLVGEAMEAESAMTGLEVDEDDLQTRHLAEQISEMIKASPKDAGNLLGKWVEYDD